MYAQRLPAMHTHAMYVGAVITVDTAVVHAANERYN